jgi:hypothetical protein
MLEGLKIVPGDDSLIANHGVILLHFVFQLQSIIGFCLSKVSSGSVGGFMGRGPLKGGSSHSQDKTSHSGTWVRGWEDPGGWTFIRAVLPHGP